MSLIPKPEYRYKYFRDAQAGITTLSTAVAGASVAYASNKTDLDYRTWFVWGLALLFISVILQMLILLFNIIGAGFDYDYQLSDRQDKGSNEAAQFFGRTAGSMLVLSTLSTILGLACLSLSFANNV